MAAKAVDSVGTSESALGPSLAVVGVRVLSAARVSAVATHSAVTSVQPALTKFYDGLSDEQKARFNSLRADAAGTYPPPAPGRC